ncbi:hypothetical protein [Streptomyces olindensis]|uniref:hypothetical protein n=1 Tax=Streptomyces olindensis TaxID=358823 RepID=UPI0033FCA5BA
MVADAVPGNGYILRAQIDMAETVTPAAILTLLSTPPPRASVEGWLASAHPSPDTARSEWGSAARLALIPLGSLFEAVRLPEQIVHCAAGSDESSVLSERLAQHLGGGPVIHAPAFRRYYALVPPGTAQAWLAPVAECLGEGTYLGVPRADRTERDERRQTSYWMVPMVRPGRLCRPGDVLALVMQGDSATDEDES